jgi:hypothetical protein
MFVPVLVRINDETPFGRDTLVVAVVAVVEFVALVAVVAFVAFVAFLRDTTAIVECT